MLRVVSALRRIAQAMDSHSKWLEGHARLTVPQLLVLEALRHEAAALTAGALAERVSLTQGTVTSILDRLEAKSLITRVRATEDRRRVLVALTREGQEAIRVAPPLMQAQFTRAFEDLPKQERESLTRALERVAELVKPPESARAAESVAEAEKD
jgi:DNA-binding MarR family transcriptional regulator